MQLTKLIYTSNHGGLTAKALDDLLLKSRANNERDGITGVLIASDEDFMQLLEGGRAVVAECFMRIMKDDRHQSIRVLMAGESGARLFSEWSMCSLDASQVDKGIVSRYWINGTFDPARMSQVAIEDLCRELSAQPRMATI
ncbi:BLUF domain-containing protein [Paracoccus gahaiensis]|uniref:BLUF domain-containing protein n=1 Tax=Paracoccus gahaiensis TaxID=1706839 RepID=A0A4U0RP34_9RHOB|nr:BLUF domain-containing protein [Paracoccus gahaiensis]TJZ89944.1 BLUF domain-containing protein [Paracoccus gahaiensis]